MGLRLQLIILVAFFQIGLCNGQKKADQLDKIVNSLLGKMTLHEKLLQMSTIYGNAAPRLGIPNLQPDEILHGVYRDSATVFPQAIALGATWDPRLIEQISTVIAKEARALGIHQGYGPMLAVSRDPRWGRVEESYGEDVYLVSRMGVAYINGLQGTGKDRFGPDHIIATPKHFVADGQPSAGSNGADNEFSERLMREVFMPPFEAAVKEAHTGSIMVAHHANNGVPCHADKWLIEDVLRKEWGFDGFVNSDLFDMVKIYQLSDYDLHRVASNATEAGILSLKAGVDCELTLGPWDSPKRCYGKTLEEEVQAGHVPMELINRSAGRIIKAKLMIFGTNYSKVISTAGDNFLNHVNADEDIWAKLVNEGKATTSETGKRADYKKILNDPAHDTIALRAAQKAIVLLKNDNSLLPMDASKLRKILVVGPLARKMNLGGYSRSKPKFYVDVVEGIKKEAGKGVEVTYEAGCNLLNESTTDIPAAVKAAESADVVVAVLGQSKDELRENLDRDNLELAGGQEKLIEAVQATGKPVIVILQNGNVLSIRWIKEHIPAIIEGWYLGQSTGTALAQVLFGKINPGGKMPMTTPLHVGRIPCYYNHLPKASTILYFQSPNYGIELFPFGFGLSYTTFEYSDIKIVPAQISSNQSTTVSLNVKNTGKVAGDEVVQLYLHEEFVSLVRPVKELKAFERITLQPGESKIVNFNVGFEQLKFWKDGKWVVEPGNFDLMTGSSSEDIRLKTKIKVLK